MTHPAEVVGFALAMVAVIVVARGLADRFRVPYAIVLTGCGLLYAVLPLPEVQLDPEIVLWLIIPPLLYAAALRPAWWASGPTGGRSRACRSRSCWSPPWRSAGRCGS